MCYITDWYFEFHLAVSNRGYTVDVYDEIRLLLMNMTTEAGIHIR